MLITSKVITYLSKRRNILVILRILTCQEISQNTFKKKDREIRTWMSRHIIYLLHFDFFTISLVLIVTLSTYSTEDGLVVGKINPEIT